MGFSFLSFSTDHPLDSKVITHRKIKASGVDGPPGGKSFITPPAEGPQRSLWCESDGTGWPWPRSNLETICAPLKKEVFNDCVFPEIVKMYFSTNDLFISRPPAHFQGWWEIHLSSQNESVHMFFRQKACCRYCWMTTGSSYCWISRGPNFVPRSSKHKSSVVPPPCTNRKDGYKIDTAIWAFPFVLFHRSSSRFESYNP